MPSLSPQVFAILAALVEEKSGLHYGPDQLDAFADRAGARASELGMESLLDYYYFLRYDDPDGAELQALVESLVVHETFLFREHDQLEVIATRLIAPLVAGGARPRIWSAACATGEEPISLAVLLAERGLLEASEIVATDISERALARARGGRYGRRSQRGAMPPSATRWLRPDGECLVARSELVAAVRWQRLNLLDHAARSALGAFDVILCRNVLIYFRDDVARRVVDGLTAQLRPRGVLCVGVSESLLRFGTSLECEELGGVFLYRKPS